MRGIVAWVYSLLSTFMTQPICSSSELFNMAIYAVIRTAWVEPGIRLSSASFFWSQSGDSLAIQARASPSLWKPLTLLGHAAIVP